MLFEYTSVVWQAVLAGLCVLIGGAGIYALVLTPEYRTEPTSLWAYVMVYSTLLGLVVLFILTRWVLRLIRHWRRWSTPQDPDYIKNRHWTNTCVRVGVALAAYGMVVWGGVILGQTTSDNEYLDDSDSESTFLWVMFLFMFVLLVGVVSLATCMMCYIACSHCRRRDDS